MKTPISHTIKIVFTGGGTGGHVFPVIAVIRELRTLLGMLGTPYEFAYFGPKDEFSSVLYTTEQISKHYIFAGKLRRYFSMKNFVDFCKIPLGVIQSCFWLWVVMPDIVFSKGGYGSIPVVFAAWLYRIPIILHESDIEPGLANRILSRFAKKIIASFPNTAYFPLEKMVVLGNPIRKRILECGREDAISRFNLHFQRKIICIIGGSQGAQRINDFFLSLLPNLLTRYEIIHQTGEKNFGGVQKETTGILKEEMLEWYHPIPFFHENDLCAAYHASDLIVSRAGSGGIFEIAAHGKPSILIPLPEAAQNHQVLNAYAYGETGAAFVFEETNLAPHVFVEKIDVLFEDYALYDSMRKSAQAFAQPRASEHIAGEILRSLA